MARKTVIGDDFGEGLDLLRDAHGTDQLVHSRGVRLELPGHTWIILSGAVSVDDRLNVVGTGDVASQTRTVLESIAKELDGQGASLDNVVRMRVYVVNLTPESFREIHEVRAEYFRQEHYPASTLVEVAGLIKPELLIEIDADAIILD